VLWIDESYLLLVVFYNCIPVPRAPENYFERFLIGKEGNLRGIGGSNETYCHPTTEDYY
jgi:hypothetical protein